MRCRLGSGLSTLCCTPLTKKLTVEDQVSGAVVKVGTSGRRRGLAAGLTAPTTMRTCACRSRRAPTRQGGEVGEERRQNNGTRWRQAGPSALAQQQPALQRAMSKHGPMGDMCRSVRAKPIGRWGGGEEVGGTNQQTNQTKKKPTSNGTHVPTANSPAASLSLTKGSHAPSNTPSHAGTGDGPTR
jgi:hypothetical protein